MGIFARLESRQLYSGPFVQHRDKDLSSFTDRTGYDFINRNETFIGLLKFGQFVTDIGY